MTNEQNDEGNSICDFCSEVMALADSRTCYLCGMVTCLLHESPIDHNCEADDPAEELAR